MKIFAHRGLWETNEEENSLVAIERCFQEGFELETDIRYWQGKFLIKHDVPVENEKLLALTDVLKVLQDYPEREIAFHFKYDDWKKPGSLEVVDMLAPFANRVFLFDMSFDYCLKVRQRNSNVEVGVSIGDNEYHDAFCNLEDALNSAIDIVWADEYRNFYSQELIAKIQSAGKKVYCISPDLAVPVGHPRARVGYEKTWNDLMRWGVDGICTDYASKLKEEIMAVTIV